MRVSPSFASAGVFLTVVLTAPPAFACRCKSPSSTAVAYRQAVAVVTGEVVEHRPETRRRGARVQFKISNAWKRRLPALVTVHSMDLCYYPMEKGKEYLLFLVQDGRDYVTSRCMGNHRLSEAGEALDWLRGNAEST